MNLRGSLHSRTLRPFATTVIVALTIVTFVARPSAAQKTENILLITYDGLRWQEVFDGVDETMLNPRTGAVKDIPSVRREFWAEAAEERRAKLLPFFWETIAKHGQVYGDPEHDSEVTVTNGRYFSYPGYNEILTGKADHGIASNAKRPNKNVTVLEWLNQQPKFTGRVAAFCSWDVFPYIINEERSGVPVNAGWEPLPGEAQRTKWLNRMANEIPQYWGGVRYDVFTFEGALDHLKRRKPRVLYVGFGETDDWAHSGRYDLYLDSARRTDAYVRRLWETMQSMPQYRGKTTLIMTTDHGRGNTPDDWNGHGADTPGSERIWMAVMGPDTPAKGHVSGDYRQDQVAATVAALLGLDYAAALSEAGDPLHSALPPSGKH